MAKRRALGSKPERRSRAEIDRNFFFGDVLIKTGVAVGLVIAFIAVATPFTLRDAIDDGMYDYVTVIGLFGGIGLFSFLYGRHLRRQATHWDFD
jgi:hypothetical protein